MKKYTLVLIFMVVSAAGCRHSTTVTTPPLSDAAPSVAPEASPATVVTPPATGVVGMTLSEGNGRITIRKQERKSVYVDIPVGGFTHLNATITPVDPPEGNVRINTITLPDGTTDGPFGRSVEYDIPAGSRTGKIRIEIGESLMQGDPWEGEFTLEVRLTK